MLPAAYTHVGVVNPLEWSFRATNSIAATSVSPGFYGLLEDVLQRIINASMRVFAYLNQKLEILIRCLSRQTYTDGGSERFTSHLIVQTWKRVFSSTSLDPKKCPRKEYQSTLLNWRNGAQKSTTAPSEAYCLFRNKEVIESVKNELFTTIGNRSDENWQEIDSLQGLEKAYRQFWQDCIGPSGNASGLFDPIFFGNIPFNWHELTIAEGKKCQLIRMPTATQDSKNSSGKLQASITEEFFQYTKSLKQKNERHLYVNLMRRDEANEAMRSRVLEEFGEKNYREIIMVSLDKNSAFYTQKGRKEQRADDFFEEMKKSLSDPNLYSWPVDLQKNTQEEIQSSTPNQKF